MDGISYIGIIIVVSIIVLIISVVLIINSRKYKKNKGNDIFCDDTDNKENDIF